MERNLTRKRSLNMAVSSTASFRERVIQRMRENTQKVDLQPMREEARIISSPTPEFRKKNRERQKKKEKLCPVTFIVLRRHGVRQVWR
jgi:hypothetical protein